MLVMSIAAFARRITHYLRYLSPTLALAVCHVDSASLPPQISGLADKIGGMFWFTRPGKVTRMEARQKAGSQGKGWDYHARDAVERDKSHGLTPVWGGERHLDRRHAVL
ncbi:hypothetical protein QR685DRAFT_533928, partial [Neurospora intermedia]